MNPGSFKNEIPYKLFTYKSYIYVCVCKYVKKMDERHE